MNLNYRFYMGVIGFVLLIGTASVFLFVWLSSPSSTAPSSSNTGNTTGSVTVGGSSGGLASDASSGDGTVGSAGVNEPAETDVAGPKITIPVGENKTVQVNDFRNLPETIAVPPENTWDGSTQYFLVENNATTSSPFNILYIEKDNSFTISLLQEPLGEMRKQAEAYMMQKLGINEVQMCALNYWMGTTIAVNSFYSGKNLGFSFCPGAIAL